jgi:hypothetical protein
MTWAAGALVLTIFWIAAHGRALRRIRTASYYPDPAIQNLQGEPGLSDQFLSRELFLPRDWQFTNMPVEQCTSYFTGMSRVIDPNKRGLNIVLGKAPNEVRNVTLDLKRTSLINALELAAKAAGLRVEEGADNTVILTPGFDRRGPRMDVCSFYES